MQHSPGVSVQMANYAEVGDLQADCDEDGKHVATMDGRGLEFVARTRQGHCQRAPSGMARPSSWPLQKGEARGDTAGSEAGSLRVRCRDSDLHTTPDGRQFGLN